MSKSKKLVTVPSIITQCWIEYDGESDPIWPDEVVAVREASEFYAVLMKSKPENVEENGPFWAITFRHTIKDGNIVWDVENDYCGPFGSIRDFTDSELARVLM